MYFSVSGLTHFIGGLWSCPLPKQASLLKSSRNLDSFAHSWWINSTKKLLSIHECVRYSYFTGFTCFRLL